MVEYVKLVNNNGFVTIDDSYQNYHLYDKRSVLLSEMVNYDPRYSLVVAAFTVTGLKKPVVAVRVEVGDPQVYGATYDETSPNTWFIRVFFSKVEQTNSPSRVATIYTYGLIPEDAQPSSGAVLQIRGANNQLIFDSGKSPMKILKCINHNYQDGTVGADSWSKNFPIPQYSADKVYAVVPSQLIYFAWFVSSGPGYWNYDIYCGYCVRNSSDPSKLYNATRKSGSVNDRNYPFSVMGNIFQSFLVIDVTGY